MNLEPSLRGTVAQRVDAARVHQTHEPHCTDVRREHRVPIDAIRAGSQSAVALQHILEKTACACKKVEMIAVACLLLPNILTCRTKVE